VTARGLSHRSSVLWIAALGHRLSGLALAMFLPVHFLTLKELATLAAGLSAVIAFVLLARMF
jgi:succinate dehydrogenase/fumarate reductase cytochrome b subunit